jgi:hypothetical protein
MQWRALALLFICNLAIDPARLYGADVVSRLLKDTVATFSDSYDLLYYSLKSALQRDLREQAKAVQETRDATNERIEAYLEAKGILLRRDSQPITRRDFARILIERFDLPKGFFTRLTGSSRWYFRDAVRAGLFSETDAAEGTMSTREMLSVFTRAEQLSRSR